MKKIISLSVLAFLVVFLISSCGNKEKKESEKMAQFIVYYETDSVENCKKQLIKKLQNKYDVISDEYKSDEEMFNEFKELYNLDEDLNNDKLENGLIVCTIVIGNIDNQDEADKVKKYISEISKVKKVQMLFPYEEKE